MAVKRLLLVGLVGFAVAGGGLQSAQAGDLKITIPKRSTLTPVQRLNREGVEAVRKHNYAKAEQLFYKAYLVRSGRRLHAQQSRLHFGAARADRSGAALLCAGGRAVERGGYRSRQCAQRIEGRPMKDALALTDQPLQINHANVEAVRLAFSRACAGSRSPAARER